MKKRLLTFTVLLLSAGYLMADIIEKTYQFSSPEITELNGFQKISFENTMQIGLAGEPMLPYSSVSLLLPPGHAAKDIQIIAGEEIFLEGTYQIYPMQHSQPLSKGGSGVFALNEAVYQNDALYPQKITGELSTQFMNGYAIALNTFTPVRYNPATGKVSYFKSVTLKLTTAQDEKSQLALQNLRSSKQIQSRLESIAQNIENVSAYPQTDSRSDDYDMIIISPEAFETGFQELVDFYAPRGIRAQIVTTSEIYELMTGQDNQEKIRNYIIQEYQDHGIQHVTLGGDVEHVPYRGFYCHVQSSSVYEDDDIPADLYYAGLDGTWNDNGNNLWAEIGEDDLLPEIGIGRFSISTPLEFSALMNKTIQYQENPVVGQLHNPLLVGEWLYGDPETYGSDYLELLIGYQDENGYITNGIPEDQDIEKLYESEGSWSASTLMNKMNEGSSFIHHVGHANSNYTMKFYNSDITNSNFSNIDGSTHNYALIFSHGCICGAFDDNDCIAEKMIGIENLAAAVYMNSRYGWFNEGQTEGPAGHLNRELVDAFYDKKESHLGMAYSMARIETAPWVTAPGQHEEGALRWNFYDCNLLGDAAIRFWADEPTDISAEYQEALPIGLPSISITISGDGNVEGLYCNYVQDDVSYGIAQTNAAGQAEIVFSEAITELGDAMIYVSGYNCQLHEYPVTVIPNGGAYVVYSSSVVNDENGNNNGLADYTESILLSTELSNVGTVQADNVVATISSTDEFVSITDNSEDYGNIPGSSLVNMEDAFAFDIAGNVPDQHAVSFNLDAVGQETWASSFSLTVNAPSLAMDGYYIDDATGNNNGLLDPGETADMVITGINNGHAEAYDVMASLTSSDPYIIINTSGSQEMGDLAAGADHQVIFSVSVDENVLPGHTSSISFVTEAMYDITASSEINLSFSDYCEASTDSEDEYIAQVQIGDIDNATGWQGGVGNYTDQSTVIEPGGSEEINVTNGTPWSADQVTVWVDWNLDMEFGNNPNETFVLDNVGGTGENFQGDILVPNNQMAAHYRMRVRMNYSSAPEPCGNSSYGEVEDYTLVVAGGVLAVSVSCTPDEICQGEESQMTASAGGGSGSYTYLWTPATGLSDPTIFNPIATPDVTTVYTVEINDGASSVSEQATITVHELPETPFINLEGETLFSDAAEGNQWYDSQGPIDGATGQSHTCTWEDVYHVVVNNAFGCESDPSNSVHVVVTGINDPENTQNLGVYPNPFSDRVFIEFTLDQGTLYELSVFNSLGQEVNVITRASSATGLKQSIELSTKEFEKGIYFCKLITADQVSIQKMIHTK